MKKTYCENCGEKRTKQKTIRAYCPKHLAENTIPDDVYGEEFLTLFEAVLHKFVDEYEDMAQMKLMKQAKELLKTINEG